MLYKVGGSGLLCFYTCNYNDLASQTDKATLVDLKFRHALETKAVKSVAEGEGVSESSLPKMPLTERSSAPRLCVDEEKMKVTHEVG